MESKKLEERLADVRTKELEAEAEERVRKRAATMEQLKEANEKRVAEDAERAKRARTVAVVDATGGSTEPTEAPPRCRCGLDAMRFTVKKEGPNCGRHFFKCSKKQDEDPCKFFEWSDATASAPRSHTGAESGEVSLQSAGIPLPGASSPQPSTVGDIPGLPGAASNRRCSTCGLEATLRSVQKEGRIFGRQYWCCTQPKCSTKQYFEWDEAPVDVGHSTVATPVRAAGSFGRSEAPPVELPAGSSQLLCQCGSEATSFVSKKEGPNQGRRFWTCGERRCKFFQWDGERIVEAPPVAAVGVSTGTQPGASKSSGTCFKCRQPGHFARDCPGSGTSSGK